LALRTPGEIKGDFCEPLPNDNRKATCSLDEPLMPAVFLQFRFSGIGEDSTCAPAALGLTPIHNSSRVINFAKCKDLIHNQQVGTASLVMQAGQHPATPTTHYIGLLHDTSTF
jgi:hypothetical protein